MMQSSMGERLAWARNQQGMILMAVSRRSGLAVGYISQLERGSKTNPTKQALERLANALGVSVAFILGEVPPAVSDAAGSLAVSEQARSVYMRFMRWYESLTPLERQKVADETVEKCFARVVSFLCEQFPDRFTRVVIAWQLGISVRGLNDILERNCLAPNMIIPQMATISGIPVTFFAAGHLEPESRTPQDFQRYLPVILAAMKRGLSPEQVQTAIESFRS